MKHQIREYESLLDLLDDLEREGIEGFQRRQIVNRFMMMKSRAAGIPYSGSFELTPLCNLDCKMCYVHLTNEQVERNGGILSTEAWIDIIQQAIDAGMMQAELTGGECLTHPGFMDIYRYMISRGVRVSIMTNGQLLNQSMVEFLKKYPPECIQISVYGSSPEAYLNVTGSDAYQDVVNAIQRIKNAGIRLSLSVMPSKFMKSDALQLLELVRSFGVNYGVSGVTLPARTETERERTDYIADDQLWVEIDKSEKEYRSQFKDSIITRKEYLYKVAGVEKGSMPCSSGSCAFHVNWKGELTPCVPYNKVAKSILENGFVEAWNWVTQIIKTYCEPAECANCKIKKICASCPAEKTDGVWNGTLNKDVCAKWQRALDAGLISI